MTGARALEQYQVTTWNLLPLCGVALMQGMPDIANCFLYMKRKRVVGLWRANKKFGSSVESACVMLLTFSAILDTVVRTSYPCAICLRLWMLHHEESRMPILIINGQYIRMMKPRYHSLFPRSKSLGGLFPLFSFHSQATE